MGGGGHYAGLPHPHPTVSYWQSPPHELENHRTTAELPAQAKYVVVGSGITGASIVTRLLEHDVAASDIVLLEARTACSGATGRNGGHCRAGFWTRFKRHLERYGISEALKLEALENDNVRDVTDYIKAHDIACDLQAVETADVYLTAHELDEAVENLKARDEVCAATMGDGFVANHRVLTGRDAQDYLAMPTIAGGVTFSGFTLWPYKFVCHLLQQAVSKGINLQTNTPVLSISPTTTSTSSSPSSSRRWTLTTERGTIAATHLILATNAYTGALLPTLSHAITPTRGQISAIRPGNHIGAHPALRRSAGLNGHGLEDYMISRASGLSGAGDIIYGGGRLLSSTGEQGTVDDSVINEKIARYLEDAAPGYFGREAWGENGKTLMRWTGIMGYTEDGNPVVGEVPGQKGLWVCAGFNGHGMALTWRSAQAVVEMVVGESGRVPGWFPERSMGVARIVGEKEVREGEGRD